MDLQVTIPGANDHLDDPGPLVLIGPGLSVPAQFRTVFSNQSGYEVAMEFVATSGRVTCVNVELRGSEDLPVTATAMRLVRVDELTELAIYRVARVDNDMVASLMPTPQQVRAGGAAAFEPIEKLHGRNDRAVKAASRRRDHNLAEVAQIYALANGGGGAVAELIDLLGVSEGTAWRLIRRARDAGLIPPEPMRRGPKPKGSK
jgi:hypothetical protein